MDSIKCKPLPVISGKYVERFWSLVSRRGTDECWEWTGLVDRYGIFCGPFSDGKNRRLRAHRMSYFLLVGDPGDRLVCHSCDNPICCNPGHLFVGDHDDNMADKKRKGRSAIGESNPRAVLTEWTVRRIRESSGRYSLGELAAQFGITKDHARQVINRSIWKHVGPEEIPPTPLEGGDLETTVNRVNSPG